MRIAKEFGHDGDYLEPQLLEVGFCEGLGFYRGLVYIEGLFTSSDCCLGLKAGTASRAVDQHRRFHHDEKGQTLYGIKKLLKQPQLAPRCNK